jgi:hypothetical protein
MISRSMRRARVGLPLLLMSTLTGCLTPPNRYAMSAASSGSTKRHPHSVSVQSHGGTGGRIFKMSGISDADLRVAIEGAIRRTGLFGRIAEDGQADYELDVTIVEMTRPSFEHAFTVDLETAWLLTRASDGAELLRRSVMSSQTIPANDALSDAVRLRFAMEGAARRNIRQGLEAIAALDL